MLRTDCGKIKNWSRVSAPPALNLHGGSALADSNTRKIPLRGKHGAGKFVLVDVEDFSRLSRYKWWLTSEGYPQTTINRKCVYMHRMIMGLKPGDGLRVDHISHNKLDNRRSNLRVCSCKENHRNSRLYGSNKSGFKGVYRNGTNKKPWTAQICVSYKTMYLGRFDNPEDAAKEYDRAAIKHFGEFARLNFPEKAEARVSS